MKKKLMCLFLSIIMLLSVMLMAGCNNDEEETVETEEKRYAMTLNMFMVTEDSTTDAAVLAVQDAINAVTMAKYRTKIVLTTYTEDEYMSKLDERFEAIEKAVVDAKEAAESKKEADKEAKKRGETVAKETTSHETTEEETQYNDYGGTEIKYPDLTENQLDIFFLSGIDNLVEYNDAGRLAILDDYLGSSSKKLKDFIYPTFIDAAKIEGSTVAVINNHTIGEYTLLLVNKALADKYYYDTSEYDSLSDAEAFIDDMAASEPTVTPFLEHIDAYDVYTWGDQEYSLFASPFNEYFQWGESVTASCIFRNVQFQTNYKLMKKFEENGYFSDDPDNDTNFAAAVVKASIAEKEAYEEDYYVTVLQKPTAVNEDVYQGMFCINAGSDTTNQKRAMEIITLINTDSDFRNLFQYGIEGVNYKLKDDKVVRLNNDYMMKLVNTGNEFIAYAEDGMSDTIWEEGKRQNLDSTTYSLLGYYLDEKSKKLFEVANANAKEIYDTLAAASYAELLKETAGEFTNPFEVALESSVMVKNYSSITSSALEENFGAKLAEWFETNS